MEGWSGGAGRVLPRSHLSGGGATATVRPRDRAGALASEHVVRRRGWGWARAGGGEGRRWQGLLSGAGWNLGTVPAPRPGCGGPLRGLHAVFVSRWAQVLPLPARGWGWGTGHGRVPGLGGVFIRWDSVTLVSPEQGAGDPRRQSERESSPAEQPLPPGWRALPAGCGRAPPPM